jgi:hypothetical protein
MMVLMPFHAECAGPAKEGSADRVFIKENDKLITRHIWSFYFLNILIEQTAFDVCHDNVYCIVLPFLLQTKEANHQRATPSFSVEKSRQKWYTQDANARLITQKMGVEGSPSLCTLLHLWKSAALPVEG